MSYCTVESLIESNRLFQILNDRLQSSEWFEKGLYDKIVDYTNRYFALKEASTKQVAGSYIAYIRSYNRDVSRFLETQQYPYELNGGEVATLDRFSYNVVLLLSVVFAPHRFRIMQLISEYKTEGEVLMIGCGPGLEMALVGETDSVIDAYDLSLEQEVKSLNPEVSFYETYFDQTNEKKYDQIYLIEILEHLSDPLALLKICKNALKVNGKIHLTTATNIPQFDHLYNFTSDHLEFDADLDRLNFQILYEEDILHEYLTSDPKSKNKYYLISLA